MGTLMISDKMLDKYFGFLKMLDIKTKRRLILKLEESIASEPIKKSDPNSFYGAWEDERDADSIIKEILNSRVEKSIPKSF